MPFPATGTSSYPTITDANYHEYQLYDQRTDPVEHVNLAGRKEYRQTADNLRAQLLELMSAAGEPQTDIVPAKLYP